MIMFFVFKVLRVKVKTRMYTCILYWFLESPSIKHKNIAPSPICIQAGFAFVGAQQNNNSIKQISFKGDKTKTHISEDVYIKIEFSCKIFIS